MLRNWMRGALAALLLASLSIGPAGLPVATAPAAASGFSVDGGAWTTCATTLTAGAGSFTSTSTTACRYKRIGKIVYLRITILITTNGTASSFFTLTAPFATPSVASGAFQSLSVTTTGATGLGGRAVIDNNSSTITVTKYDGTYLGQDSLFVHVTGIYEAA